MEGYWFVLTVCNPKQVCLYLSHTEDANLGYNSIIEPVCLSSIASSLERMDNKMWSLRSQKLLWDMKLNESKG